VTLSEIRRALGAAVADAEAWDEDPHTIADLRAELAMVSGGPSLMRERFVADVSEADAGRWAYGVPPAS
jgi:hypothetical protein